MFGGERVVNYRTLEIVEELGRVKVSEIDDLGELILELHSMGYSCYFSSNTDYLIVELACI